MALDNYFRFSIFLTHPFHLISIFHLLAGFEYSTLSLPVAASQNSFFPYFSIQKELIYGRRVMGTRSRFLIHATDLSQGLSMLD